MVAALRDVNGRYVGNRPVRLKKSNWKDGRTASRRGFGGWCCWFANLHSNHGGEPSVKEIPLKKPKGIRSYPKKVVLPPFENPCFVECSSQREVLVLSLV